MKKILSIAVLGFVAHVCLVAQATSFIEITVEDTMKLKAINIKYLISESPYSTNYTYDANDTKKEENKRAPQSVLGDIEKILKTNKYNYSKYTETKNYKISSSEDYGYDYGLTKNGNPGWLVEVKTTQELEDLYNLLKDQKGITGKIIDVQMESKDTYLELSMTRLYNKAKKEAELLASLTGLKLGKVISVSELTSNNSYSMMDWYKDILSFGKYDEGLFGKDLTSVYSRKLTFKFETN